MSTNKSKKSNSHYKIQKEKKRIHLLGQWTIFQEMMLNSII